MKINAWFRFCLIALCVVMAASMFACGNKKNDETTTAPVGTTTEATESPSTEAPATEETEAPTTETTEAPTTQTTEAPTTQTTEKPTTETTEKPTTETTEAPTTETTEAPTTETTEAPTTETTEEIVTEPPVEGDFLEFWDKDDLYYDVAFNKSVFTVDSTDNGVKLMSLKDGDAPTTFFEGRTAEKENLTATGKYLFMKYKTFTEGMYIQIFTATDKTGPDGGRVYKLNDGKDIFADGEWHLLIIDLTECISAIAPAEDGQYYLQHFRMDFEYEEGVSIEIAYIGLTDEIKDIADYAQATETEDSLKAVCPHPTECAVGESVDASSHTTVCSLCGKAGEASAHVTDAGATWNEETGRYEATCTVCGGVAAKEWQWSRDYSDYADGHTFGQNGKGGAHSVQNGILVMTPNGNTSWAGVSLGVDGATQVGQYYALKYRVTEVTTESETASINLRFGTIEQKIDLIADGEWHIMLVDISFGGTTANGLVTPAKADDHWFLNYVDANLISYEVAFEGCVDSLDRMALSENECPHPEAAKKNVSIDAENHALSCVICGKQFGEAEAHNITETPDVPAGCFTPGYTGGSSCSDCGYIVEAATATDPVGHKTTDLDGEYCPVCKSFINADPTTLFNKFIGGKDVPYVSALGDQWSANGYRVYTHTGSETYVYPAVAGGVTGQYMVLKYKATGTINFEFFQSTVQSGAKAGWSFRYYPSTYDEWQYYIVDLTTVLPADAMVAVDGTYSIKGLRWDVEGTGTAEIAYLAYADSLEKLINGIKALAGDEINEDYCLHSSLLNTYESIDDATHALVCALCGKQAVEEHTFDAKAFWNETNARYEASCVLCDGGVEARDWQWSRDYSDYASGHQFGNTGGGNTHSIQDGVLVMSPNGNTTWGGVSVGTATTIGQYYVLKYRVTEVAEAAETAKIELRFGAIKDIDLIADGEWHVMIIDLAALNEEWTATNGLIESTGDHWFLNYKDANLIKYEVAFEGCVDSMDRIPAEYKPAE